MNNEKIPQFLIEMLHKQYGIEQTEKIIRGYETKRATTLRVNTIKSNSEEIEKTLKNNNINFEKSIISNNAYIIKNADETTIKEMSIYKDGKIYMQSLSSMLPPIILDPQPNKDILDMAAAPGGKTTQMAALSNNKAHITACELNKIRAERLKYNVEKQGASCVYCMVKDSRNIDNFFSFDQILLDAPCSGSGTLNIDDYNIEEHFTQKLIQKSVKAQKALLNKAINILESGCEMVYSTCSILECENEDVINNILQTGIIEVVPIENTFINSLPLLTTKISGTLCVAPNELFEGFFIAKLKKK